MSSEGVCPKDKGALGSKGDCFLARGVKVKCVVEENVEP